ncbi:uncharacterized protein LOC119677740 [Teleopsis dalmanni]|uniref:uncharacterized protein LOC119677740 n=1 Tax=Teleopsis dalmanni TaxID=139649 RepID=UPI0018CF97AA|nr:uncharacterized protein LOC119677740 [Teleopsis dalmanni]
MQQAEPLGKNKPASEDVTMPIVSMERMRAKPGILRLDVNKPRRSSGGSVEFHPQPQILRRDTGSPSGVTSPHQQLSVTWATPCNENAPKLKFKSTSYYADASLAEAISPSNREGRANKAQEDKLYEPGSNLTSPVDTIDFPLTCHCDEDKNNESDVDDDEDYSISVSAIMQRRASVRGNRSKRGSRNSRRASSPMDHVLDSAERRRSSVYTTSSDEGTNQESTQEQIFENIRIHKEVIQSVKLQPWPMRKKLKLVRQAKTYVARHEGALQERFAMSRSTRDLWARFKILMAARWRHWKRETASFLTVLIPWELRIKEIESHFGSGVASYFTFLRWLMWVNIMIAIPLMAFVIGPEYFATKYNEIDPRKKMSDQEFKVAGNFLTFWEFGGYLKYSPMFYGYYSSFSGASSLSYNLPLAYFLTAVVVYIYSFVATLRKMAENSRNSKLSSKDDECTFSWKLFTGWDFMIGHAETAHNRIASVVVGFREFLLEEAEKKKDNRNWRIILQRILVNILILGLLAASGYTVVALVNNSEKLARQDNWLSRNAVNVTMTLLSFFMPMIFEALGLFENWHPRQQLRLQLARIMILNMLNLYSLMFSFIYNINSKEKPLQDLKLKNESATHELADLELLLAGLDSITTTTFSLDYTTTTTELLDESSTSTTGMSESDIYSTTNGNGSTTDLFLSTTAAAIYNTIKRLKCYNITVRCSELTRVNNNRNLTTTLLLLNLTTTMMPMTTILNTDVPTEDSTIHQQETIWTTLPPTMIINPTMLSPSTITESTITHTIYGTTKGLTEFVPTTTDMATATATVKDVTTFDYKDTTSVSDKTYVSPKFEQQQSTSTTIRSPGNDSFFEYYDYFAGMPFESEDADYVADKRKQITTSKPENVLKTYKETNKKKSKQLHRKSRDFPTASNIENIRNEVYQQQLPKTKNSRRRNEQLPSATTTATYPNSDEKQHTFNTEYSNFPITTRTAANVVTTTMETEAETEKMSHLLTTSVNNANANRIENEELISIEPPSLWQPNANLRKILEYFTTSTTPTIPTTSETAAPTTTTTITESTTLRTVDYDTTLQFIADDDIIETDKPYYIDTNDNFFDDNFDTCIRTICEEIPVEQYASTTEIDVTVTPSAILNTTDITTRARSLQQIYQERWRKVNFRIKEVRKNLTSMCWETSLGQELSKVIVYETIMSIVAPLCIDFLRALFVRYVNPKWCWDMEKTFPQYGDFKIAENILTLINNQGQVWMGIFFSPGLVLLNLVKLIIMMYFRSWIVLTCNVPHEVVFKASKSNNFYLSLLLTMLFLCVLPVGYAIVWLRPSWHCGPFSDYNRISEFITNTTRNALPKQLHEPLEYLTSSSTVIPLLLLLILIIYYLVSLTGALREANQDLRTQLQKEREEERKKIFKVPETKQTEPTAATLTNRWRKVLEASSPITPTQPPDFKSEEYKNQARKELITRIMKEALRKGSATSDDDSFLRNKRDEDDTDTEYNESLPDDEKTKGKQFGLSKLQQIRRTRKPSLVDIVQIAKSERERAAGKDVHSKGRLKIEKHDKRSKDKLFNKENNTETVQLNNMEEKENTMNSKKIISMSSSDNDFQINSRIVNERRQSLMRNENEIDDEHYNEMKSNEKQTQNTEKTNFQNNEAKNSVNPIQKADETNLKIKEFLKSSPNDKSKFEIIDEKKSLSDPITDSPIQHKETILQHMQNGAKSKHKRHKTKTTASVISIEPEVFKFDEKSIEKSNSFEKELKSMGIPATPTSPDISTESHVAKNSNVPIFITPSSHKDANNTDLLINLSRQGRKKIGSLLALVREAVNTKKAEEEQLQVNINSNHQTTNAFSASSKNNNINNNTAIDMPLTPEALLPHQLPTYAQVAAFKQPQAHAPLEDAEELDEPTPICFPHRTVSQSHRAMTIRQDSQTSVWSDNIPTITISTTGSEECIAELKEVPTSTNATTPTSPKINIIKIEMEVEQEEDKNDKDNNK